MRRLEFRQIEARRLKPGLQVPELILRTDLAYAEDIRVDVRDEFHHRRDLLLRLAHALRALAAHEALHPEIVLQVVGAERDLSIFILRPGTRTTQGRGNREEKQKTLHAARQ